MITKNTDILTKKLTDYLVEETLEEDSKVKTILGIYRKISTCWYTSL